MTWIFYDLIIIGVDVGVVLPRVAWRVMSVNEILTLAIGLIGLQVSLTIPIAIGANVDVAKTPPRAAVLQDFLSTIAYLLSLSSATVLSVATIVGHGAASYERIPFLIFSGVAAVAILAIGAAAGGSPLTRHLSEENRMEGLRRIAAERDRLALVASRHTFYARRRMARHIVVGSMTWVALLLIIGGPRGILFAGFSTAGLILEIVAFVYAQIGYDIAKASSSESVWHPFLGAANIVRMSAVLLGITASIMFGASGFTLADRNDVNQNWLHWRIVIVLVSIILPFAWNYSIARTRVYAGLLVSELQRYWVSESVHLAQLRESNDERIRE